MRADRKPAPLGVLTIPLYFTGALKSFVSADWTCRQGWGMTAFPHRRPVSRHRARLAAYFWLLGRRYSHGGKGFGSVKGGSRPGSTY